MGQGIQEEAISFLTEAQDWEEPTLKWIGLDLCLMNSDESQ